MFMSHPTQKHTTDPCLIRELQITRFVVFLKINVELQPHLYELIEHHGVKARQVLNVIPLHHGAILPHMCPQLFHVEDQLCNVPVKTKK